MASITRYATVTAPPEAVWEVLSDFGAISSWARNVDHSCLLEHGDDIAVVGTTRRVQVGRETLVERITESVAPNVLAYDIEGLPRPMRRVSNRWVVSTFGKPTTVIGLTSTVEIGPLAWPAEKSMCLLMSKQSDTMLQGLAARVERRRGSR